MLKLLIFTKVNQPALYLLYKCKLQMGNIDFLGFLRIFKTELLPYWLSFGEFYYIMLNYGC